MANCLRSVLLLACVLLALVLPGARAADADFHLARFDLQRVFAGYLHTQELEREIDAKRNVTGPRSERPEDDTYRQAEKRHLALAEKIKQTAEDSPARPALEQDLKVAALELQVAERGRKLQAMRREKEQVEKARQDRSGILDEIMAEARTLAAERGDTLVIPEYRTAIEWPSIVAAPSAPDLTEQLLTRLNSKYHAPTSPPR